MNPLELLFPRKCPFCGKLLETEELLCADCRQTLPWTGNACRTRGSFFSLCVSPLRYEGKARQALLRYKFSGKRSYSRCFGKLMADCVRTHTGPLPDIITYVPVSYLRFRKRGYSQSRLLAEAVSRELGIPCARLLVKRRHTGAQSRLHGEAARKANVSGAFRMEKHAAVTEREILLVDDVVTTGATLAECSRVLLTAGAERVSCAALCCAARGRQKEGTAV